jgi:hypothetical protein
VYTNLLAKIEGELNQTAIKLATDQLSPEEVNDLKEKKNKIENLAFQYVALENQYREIAGLNSIY